MSVFGFKLQPTEISKLLGIKGAEFRRFYATTKKSVNKIARDLSQGTISQDEAQKELDELYRNLEREALRFQDIAQVRQQNVRGGYIVPQVKDDPKTRINPLTGEPYEEEEEETRTPRQGFIVGGMAQSEVTGTTPLENELYALQQQSEVGLPQEDEYGGIEKKERGVKRLGFVEGGEARARMQEINTYLKGKGYSKEARAGILANISVETGNTYNPFEQEKGDSKKGYGLFQLTGKRKDYNKWMKENNFTEQTVDNIPMQLEYMHETIYGNELTNTKRGREIGGTNASNLQKSFNEKSAEEIALDFSNIWERPNPKKAHNDWRVERATQIYNNLKE